MKKKLTQLLTGLLVVSFVGCASPTTPSEAPASSEETETTVSVEATDSTDAVEATSEESSEAVSEETVSESEEEIPLPEVSLKEIYAEHGLKVGTCLSPQMLTNTKTTKLITDQFSSITMENDMKPDYLFNQTKSKEEGNLVVEFNKNAIKMLDWAKENNLSLRGHTIVWYSQTPDWIFYEDFDKSKELVGRDVMLGRLDSIMKQVFGSLQDLGYSDMFYAYDIINEAWMEDGSMRENNWTKTIGEDYMQQAFRYAQMYAPENIDLYYNDYNEQFKTDTYLKFIDSLKDENGEYLLDGIGLQAHLYTKDDLKAYFKMVDAISATGLKMEMTELDVSLGAWQNTLQPTEENLKIQGKFYYDLINGLLERIDAGTLKMDSITYWGFCDSMSWRKDASPLLYDKSLTPKYALYGAAQMKDYAGFDD